MKIAIIGAGIAGLTTAIALKKKNIETVIFEASPEIKGVGAGIGLAANAIKAFEVLGLKEELIDRGCLLNAFHIYDQHGNKIATTDTTRLREKFGEDNFTIHRADLHAFLLQQLPTTSLHTNKRLKNMQQADDEVQLDFMDGSTFTANYVLVADGVHSVARQQLLPESKPRYAGYTCWRAVIDAVELKLPDVSEIWGPQGRFGIVPLKNNKIYWFACINSPENSERAKNFTVADLMRQFKGYPVDVEAVLKATQNEDLIWNDIIDLKPINRFAFGRIVLLGDAAHATTPNMGQGACQAIEDAVYLAEMMSQHDYQDAFRIFEKSRMKRVHWVTNNSRTLGWVAQFSNPLLTKLRNAMLKLVPASFNEKQLEKLYQIQFS